MCVYTHFSNSFLASSAVCLFIFFYPCLPFYLPVCFLMGGGNGVRGWRGGESGEKEGKP